VNLKSVGGGQKANTNKKKWVDKKENQENRSSC